MNITIIGVGKIKEKYLKLGIDEFSKRLTKYCKLDVIELDDEKCPENLSEKDMLIVKDKEGKKILSKIKNNSYVIALAIDGKYSITDAMKEQMKVFIGGWASEEKTASEIKRVYEKTGYVMDTHTAVHRLYIMITKKRQVTRQKR